MTGPVTLDAAAVMAEDEAWEALNETQAMRSCDCPSCNHYLPQGEYQPETQCVTVAAIEKVFAARLNTLRRRITETPWTAADVSALFPEDEQAAYMAGASDGIEFADAALVAALTEAADQ